jgi:Flp pilus assembly protein TadB
VTIALACVLAAAAGWLVLPPAVRRAAPVRPPDGVVSAVSRDDAPRRRWLWATLAGVGTWAFVSGVPGLAAGLVAATVCWVVLSRAETPAQRRLRAATRSDLPHLVGLLAAAVRGGLPVGDALAAVCSALPGPAADLLASLPPRLALGLEPAEVWRALEGDEALAPLGRTLVRAQQTGEPVAAALDRLATELAARDRGETEDRARRVGVQAAVPLGLCLLPSFVLLGIVPWVAGMVDALDW